MNKIAFPLEHDGHGSEVTNLQDALVVFLRRGAIPSNSEAELTELVDGVESERHSEKYGELTYGVVKRFQKAHQLEQSGNVDEPTARAMNALLDQWGIFNQPLPERSAVVSGRVLDAAGAVVKSRLVRAFHEAGHFSIRLGDDKTDADGRYTIRYDLLPAVASINLRVRVLDENDETLLSSDLRSNAAEIEIVDLTLPEIAEPVWRVFGTVRDTLGELLDGVTVQAIDRNLRNEQLLGETIVQAGKYEIHYDQSRFRIAEKTSVDLVLKVLDQRGRELHKTPIHHNAPRDFELNITLGGNSYQGPSEWESLTGMLISLLENVTPLDLREDEQFQDFSFLGGETGRDRFTLAMWSMCFRLANTSAQQEMELAPEVFFAFLRQGQPIFHSENLIEDMQHPDRSTLLHDKILRDMSGIAPNLQKSLLEKAIAENLIPARFRPQIEEILDVLRRFHLHYAAETAFGSGKGTISQLLELTPPAKQKQAAFMNAFTTHQGPIETFWKKLVDDQILPAETGERVRLSFELGALTQNHIPLVGELVGQFERGELSRKRELAKLSREQWKEILGKPGPNREAIGVPADIEGETPEDRMNLFADMLDRQFERAYPTASFAGKLSRNELSSLASTADLVRFFDNNPDLNLDQVRLDQYLADVGPRKALQGLTNKNTAMADLKSVQRVFKLNPSFEVVDALLTRKIDSSQQIYFMGEGQFRQTIAGSQVNELEAKRLYRKAENAYAYALAMYGDFNLALNGVAPFGIPSHTPDPEIQARIATLPNLQSLFGSMDYCECTHCRSIYSPAAYFVDVMRFLDARGTNNPEKSVRDVLLDRRPDLGEIELSCENTNTPLPYIDLVNEILEDMVHPPDPVWLNVNIEADLIQGVIKDSVRQELGWANIPISAEAQVFAKDAREHWAVRDGQHAYKIRKVGEALQLFQTRQTFLSAAEVRANPEYTNDAAYEKLATEVFPLNLPFDLWQVQVRTYLYHLGVPQPRLQELFLQPPDNGPSDLQIDCAWLGITETERQILTGVPFLDKESWDYWGLSQTDNNLPNPENPGDPTKNVTGTWIQVLASVNIMLNRSGLTYKELLQLLDMRYINPNGKIEIATSDPNTANCDTSIFTIKNLDADALDRMHRFIRLWRKLDCPMWDLDLLLPDAGIKDGVLQDVSRISRLQEQTNLDWRTIRSFYHDIDHKVYLDRNRTGFPPIQTLYQRLFHNRLLDTDPDAGFPATPAEIGGTIAAKFTAILAALRINQNDLELILSAVGRPVNDPLDIGVLNTLHRFTALAQSLNLNIDQFLRLKRLCEDPFASPVSTLQFIRLVQQIADSRFSVLELDYLLQNQFTPGSGVALNTEKIVAAVTSIRDGLQEIEDRMPSRSAESNEAYVRTNLGLLPFLATDANRVKALKIIDDTYDGTDEERAAFLDGFFWFLNRTDVKEKLAKLPEPSPEEVAERFAYIRPGLELFLLHNEEYMLGRQKESLILQKVAEAMQLDVPTTVLLLSELIVVFDPVTVLFHTLNDSRLLAKNADGTYAHAIDIASFPDIFKSFRLLHKNAMVISKLNMKAVDVRWWLNNTSTARMGWMQPNGFQDDKKVDIKLWLAMQQFYAWKEELPKSDVTALEFATDLVAPDEASLISANRQVGLRADQHSQGIAALQTSDQIISTLAKLTGWSEVDLKRLRTAFQWEDENQVTSSKVIRRELRKSANLIRLADCMRALRRLGVSADRAIDWAQAKTEPNVAVEDRFKKVKKAADSLKQTLKAKYDLKQWLQVIQPIQDGFREQKRQALVSWLIAHPAPVAGQNWFDANGLYSYFLIDVEMSPCMLTSRIKQAAASAQLFVQRCLLDLEDDIHLQTDDDSKWKQWKWMKQYRVWEANRKVFLYPENWIEPELRDEKSPFFKDLETELAQNEITNETAERAYLKYLEKLDKVANLEIRAFHNEVLSADESLLHVFGRTRSSLGMEHYYRKQINGGRWTSWEKVELDINANHLIAGVQNRRLYLLWPQFLAKAKQPDSVPYPAANTAIDPRPEMSWELRLFWSELQNGKWTPKVLSDSFVHLDQSDTGAGGPENVDFVARFEMGVPVKIFRSPAIERAAPTNSDLKFFVKVGKQIATHSSETDQYLVAPFNGYFFNNLLKHVKTALYFGHELITLFPGSTTHPTIPQSNDRAIPILWKLRGDTYSVVNLEGPTEPTGLFFIWDTEHSYLVNYKISKLPAGFDFDGAPSQASGEQWSILFGYSLHYHPYVELFIKELNIWGLKGLLNRRIQVSPTSVPGTPAAFNFADYEPTFLSVRNVRVTESAPWWTYPPEDVDFTYLGAYAPYNWELFFHIPFFIANKLSANQRFEEALEWFHYIFDPTSTENTIPNPGPSETPTTPQQKFWITKPFYETTQTGYDDQKIETIMRLIAEGNVELLKQVEEWRNNPFNPHLIARMRTVSYQKNVLIKYIQTLIAWADQLFRRDTIETINEATQLYILAASILGPRPKSIPRRVANPPKTFYQLQEEIDEFGNALKDVENLLPNVSPVATQGEAAAELPHLNVFYFCIPHNEKLLTLWDTVADRLFKIRHCMNIEGIVRQLPLFEPPIDPALLVRATAAGLDIGAALSDMNAPMPLYRFAFMIQRAFEICDEVKRLGGAMLAALEKRDAEAFTLLRSSHEQVMLDKIRTIKVSQIDEALRTKEALEEAKKVIEAKRDHYDTLIKDGWNNWEKAQLGLAGASLAAEMLRVDLEATSAALALIPTLDAGSSGFGGSPTIKFKFGGMDFAISASGAARALQGLASIFQIGSGMASAIGGYARRDQDWDLQKQLGDKELLQVDKQIAAADIRHQIAVQDLLNHDKQIEHAQKEDEYLRSKFTNRELYDWMLGQISTVYFQSYQLAYDMARRAERCFRHELGLSDSSYIQFGYWDSLKKGLLSGEKLHYDLKRLEASYYEQNRREFELTKQISLAQLDPVALLKLKQNGECFLDIPETVFDMDYPGHYFRRLKSVGLSIPCVAGPYTTVACTLTLVSNHLRKDATLLETKYERKTDGEDLRFRDEIAAIQSIATSNAQNDHGMFELNFRDERYLPFEGAGAISSWEIRLNKDFPQFDYSTISDVIIHVSYTAREGGELLRSKAAEEFNQKMNELALSEKHKGLFRVFDLKREYSSQWAKFLHPANATDDQALVLEGLEDRLPFFTRKFPKKKVSRIEVLAKMKDNKSYELAFLPLTSEEEAGLLALELAPSLYQGLHQTAVKDLPGDGVDFRKWTIKIRNASANDFKSLPVDAIHELFLVINYTIT